MCVRFYVRVEWFTPFLRFLKMDTLLTIRNIFYELCQQKSANSAARWLSKVLIFKNYLKTECFCIAFPFTSKNKPVFDLAKGEFVFSIFLNFKLLKIKENTFPPVARSKNVLNIVLLSLLGLQSNFSEALRQVKVKFWNWGSNYSLVQPDMSPIFLLQKNRSTLVYVGLSKKKIWFGKYVFSKKRNVAHTYICTGLSKKILACAAGILQKMC